MRDVYNLRIGHMLHQDAFGNRHRGILQAKIREQCNAGHNEPANVSRQWRRNTSAEVVNMSVRPRLFKIMRA